MFLPIDQRLELERLIKVISNARRVFKYPSLTLYQLLVLFYIYKHEPINFRTLSENYSIPAGTLFRHVNLFLKQGFVIKDVRAPVKWKVAYLSMSDRGRKFVEDLLQTTS